jgi:hypothetical protein
MRMFMGRLSSNVAGKVFPFMDELPGLNNV